MTAPVGNPQFITPEGHSLFLAKKLFDGMGQIKWGALAYIEPGGGGPEGGHTHQEGHIFVVTEGEVVVLADGLPHPVRKDEMFFVEGGKPHSIWNKGDKTAKVLKISVLP